MFMLFKLRKNMYYEFARALRSFGLLVYVIEKPLYIVAGNAKKQYRVQIVPLTWFVLSGVKAFTLRITFFECEVAAKQRSIKTLYVPWFLAWITIKFRET